MTSSAREIVSGIERLATLPAVYFEVKRIIDDPRSSVVDLAKAIASDPALTAQLLRVVNSPLYAQSRPVETVSRAVSMLGMQQVHDLVLAATLATAFARIRVADMDMAKFWRGSVHRAVAARTLAERCEVVDKERLFVQGLLSDLGHLVLFMRLPLQAIQAQQLAERTGEPVHAVEQRLLGCDYAQVGAALLERWRLPGSICAPIGEHTLAAVGSPVRLDTAVIHIAVALAEAARRGGDASAWIVPAVWDVVGLDADCLPEIAEQAAGEVDMVTALFFPSVGAAA